jgi:hypothetical protein
MPNHELLYLKTVSFDVCAFIPTKVLYFRDRHTNAYLRFSCYTKQYKLINSTEQSLS